MADELSGHTDERIWCIIAITSALFRYLTLGNSFSALEYDNVCFSAMPASRAIAIRHPHAPSLGTVDRRRDPRWRR